MVDGTHRAAGGFAPTPLVSSRLACDSPFFATGRRSANASTSCDISRLSKDAAAFFGGPGCSTGDVDVGVTLFGAAF